MVCIVCLDVLVIIRFLKSRARSLNCLTTSYEVDDFHWLKLFIWRSYMAEEKSRYNDMNTKRMLASYSLSGYCSNTSILHCFIHLQYHFRLKLCSKWMLADHSLNQLLFIREYRIAGYFHLVYIFAVRLKR